MTPPPVSPATRRPPSFRTTLVRVLVVQVITLALLGVMQAIYNNTR